jgi:hypothetical protein
MGGGARFLRGRADIGYHAAIVCSAPEALVEGGQCVAIELARPWMFATHTTLEGDPSAAGGILGRSAGRRQTMVIMGLRIGRSGR